MSLSLSKNTQNKFNVIVEFIDNSEEIAGINILSDFLIKIDKIEQNINNDKAQFAQDIFKIILNDTGGAVQGGTRGWGRVLAYLLSDHAANVAADLRRCDDPASHRHLERFPFRGRLYPAGKLSNDCTAQQHCQHRARREGIQRQHGRHAPDRSGPADPLFRIRQIIRARYCRGRR